MSYPQLKIAGKPPYVAGCCNVIAEWLGQSTDTEYTEERTVNEVVRTFKIEEITHKVRCPNPECRQDYLVHEKRESPITGE